MTSGHRTPGNNRQPRTRARHEFTGAADRGVKSSNLAQSACNGDSEPSAPKCAADPYCARKAVRGSTLVARRAGT
jgi:hypothetical protein